jgi:hypothetical protein
MEAGSAEERYGLLNVFDPIASTGHASWAIRGISGRFVPKASKSGRQRWPSPIF